MAVLVRTLLAALALTLGTGVYAADRESDGGLSRGDRAFVERALVDGATAVELGKLVQEKGQSDVVKQFGKRMVDDHTTAGDELKGIIGKIAHTPRRSGADPKTIKKLSGKAGPAFDHAYTDLMVKEHEKAVKLFRQQADKGRNADLKQFAAKTIPMLRDHLQMARDIKVQSSGDRKKK